MEVLYLLVPLSLGLAALVVWALLWAIRTGQFEDLEGAAHRILRDDDDRPDPEPRRDAQERIARHARSEPSSKQDDPPDIDRAPLASDERTRRTGRSS